MKNYCAIIILIVTIIAMPHTVRATATVQVAGVSFPGVYQTVGTDLPMRGGALLRFIFFKAYAGALYMPADIDHSQVLEAVPRRLELSYFHAISAEDFAKATRKKMAENVSKADMIILSERLERFNALYRDVQPGDRYALTYLPDQGTELSLNGQRLGLIAGDDFAAAVFSIWLGPQPIDRSFKKALLGEA